MRQAVVFGGGAIGLGLLGDMLSRSSYEIKYVDTDERIASALRTHREYRFNIVGPKPEAITVTHVDGLSYANETAIIKAIAQSDVIFTATGEDALPSIAYVLAKGLIERSKKWKSLNTLCCENLHDGAALLRNYVMQKLSEFTLAGNTCKAISQDIGFADTIIGKMCKKSETYETLFSLQPLAEGLDIVIEVEPEGELMINEAALVEPKIELDGARFLDPARFEVEQNKKTFVHNGGHALLAYLGALKGYYCIRESGMDDGIKAVFYQAIVDEIGKALTKKYPNYLDSKPFEEYVNNIFSRMISPYLNDTIKRGTRSSIKKIGGHDARLTRAAKFSVEQGVTPHDFCLTIAAALILNNIKITEPDLVLFKITDLDPTRDSELATLITRAYEILVNWQRLEFPNLKLYLDRVGYHTQQITAAR